MMDLDFIVQIIEDVKERYQREEEQAILQRNMDKAIAALAGKDACARLFQEIMSRKAMFDNIERAQQRRKAG